MPSTKLRLCAMNEIFKYILDYIINTESVFVLIQNSIIIYSNSHVDKLFKAEITGRDIYRFIDPEFHDLARHRVERTMAGDNLREIELKYRAADGSPVYLSTVSRCIDFDGRKSILVIGRDLTMPRQVENVLIDVLSRYLSRKEWEYIQYCVRGFSRGEIARYMGVMPETVKTYPQRIKDKLDLDQDSLKALIDYITMRDFYS